MLEIRLALKSDYPRIAEIFNEIDPDHLTTVESMLNEDRTREPHLRCAEFVAVQGGEIIAQIDYNQHPGMYHPQKFGVWLHVPRDLWDSGVPDALYKRVQRELEPFDPIALYTTTRENRSHEIAWLEAQGFAETLRSWENHLSLASFEPPAWTAPLERVATAGYRIASLAQLEDTPQLRRELYDCWLECRRDVPRPQATTEPSFEQFNQREFGHAYLLPEAYFVALDMSQRMVATSAMWRTDEDGVLDTGLTGTRREHRAKGLGLALKIAGLTWAKTRGYAQVRTWNEQNNTVMLEINARLGFVRQPTWIDYSLTLREE